MSRAVTMRNLNDPPEAPEWAYPSREFTYPAEWASQDDDPENIIRASE
jgi:hypothetical protein